MRLQDASTLAWKIPTSLPFSPVSRRKMSLRARLQHFEDHLESSPHNLSLCNIVSFSSKYIRLPNRERPNNVEYCRGHINGIHLPCTVIRIQCQSQKARCYRSRKAVPATYEHPLGETLAEDSTARIALVVIKRC